MPTNNTHPRYAGISDLKKLWAIRHYPSLRYSQPTSSTFLNNTPNITTVADGLRKLTLHPHPQRNEWATGCLVYAKSCDQVIEETVANYLNQKRSQVRQYENATSKNASIDGIQSGVFTFLPRDLLRQLQWTKLGHTGIRIAHN